MFARVLSAALAVSFLGLSSAQAESTPQYWVDGFEAVYDRLEKNLRKPGGKNPYYSVSPAPKFPGLYLWDSAFIALIWKHHDPSIAEDVIRSVLHNQKADGRVPHVVSLLGSSPWTQPPVLSWAAVDILRHTRNLDYAASVYPKLRKYSEWLWRARRLPNGLFFWAHPYESGIDNSPRFGNRDESYYIDTTNVAAVDLSSYMVMDANALAEMAKFILANAELSALEKDVLTRDIQRFESRAAIVAAKIRELLWDEQTGYFYDLDLDTGLQIKIATVASFFPLTAKAASKEQFRRLRAHAVNSEEFNTVFPFPTVSKAEPTFEKDMWRGPVWVNTSYLAIRGVKNYEDSLAKYFSRNLVDAIYKSRSVTGTYAEFYDPDRHDFRDLSRKKGLGPLGLSAAKKPLDIAKHLFLKQMVLGTKPVTSFVGWTGLANTLAIDELGFQP